MSILSSIKKAGSGSNKKEWTKDQVIMAIGMKVLGHTRNEIAETVGHSANSVTYMFGRRFKSDEELANFTQLTDLDQYKQFAENNVMEDGQLVQLSQVG